MSRIADRQKAIALRLEGHSYSDIKNRLKVSKGTLSVWLRDFPLTDEKIRELRDWNHIRIEKCRKTKEIKRNKKLDNLFADLSDKISVLSKRELFIAGLFLYWGEGSKTSPGSVCLSNTDPHVVLQFLRWLFLMEVPLSKINVRLQLYRDMSIDSEIKFWSGVLMLPVNCFKKPYVKESNLTDITYKNSYGHGTCSIMVYDMELYNQVIQGLKYIKKLLD